MLKVNETETIIDQKIPHLLKYMGSKREILSFVIRSIKGMNVQSEWFCDLMAGTGVVGASLKGDFNIHSNDVQLYASILSNTYLLNIKGNIEPEKLIKIQSEVEILVNQFKNKYTDLNFDYDNISSLDNFIKVENEQQKLLNYQFDLGFHLFTKYYSGTYWSYEQCTWIDSIRAVAEKYVGQPEYYAILSSLIYSMSYNSQSTGHYAQYRDATSEESMKDILIYRKKNIWEYFEKKFKELIISINGFSKEYKVTTLDYLDCLRIVEKNSIIYADPPYQSVHYSRFYHTLETLVRYDYPKVFFKGRYRDDRHQSPFCKKTTVEKAFAQLFEGVKQSQSHFVLSYSDTGMITLSRIKEISNLIFKNDYKVTEKSIDHTHSKLGRNDKKYLDVKEYLLIFERK